MNFKYLWILSICFAFLNISFANEDLEIPKGRVPVGLNYFSTSKSEFENTANSISDNRMDFQLSVPVYTTISDSKKERWSLDYRLTQHNLKTELLKNTTSIIAQQLLVSDKWIAESGEFYLLSVGGLNQKENTSGVSKAFGQVTLMGTYHKEFDFVYIYGLYYGSEIDGNFILLPVLGLKTQVSADWEFSGILPLNIRFSRAMNKSAKLSFYIRPDSFRYDVSNEGKYAQAPESFTFQVQRYRAGAQWRQYLSKQLLIDGDVGFMGKQKVKIIDGEQEYASESSNGTTYLGISLNYQF